MYPDQTATPELATQTAQPHAAGREYPSLYDDKGTTLAAITLGFFIVGSIQFGISRKYLTRFVTSLVALIVGCYIADLLIAGPDTSLLSDEEHTIILHFIKDTCLMVFAYFFGLKAQAHQGASSE